MRRGAAGWPKEPIKERECSGCGGTGFMAMVQPKEPGRRIFPPRCQKCEGKGKMRSVSDLICCRLHRVKGAWFLHERPDRTAGKAPNRR